MLLQIGFHLLIDNSFVSYRLCDFWYEMQKKAKEYTKEKELLGWKDVVVWKDFKLPYLLKAIWVEYI
jgi:hypothetical protein